MTAHTFACVRACKLKLWVPRLQFTLCACSARSKALANCLSADHAVSLFQIAAWQLEAIKIAYYRRQLKAKLVRDFKSTTGGARLTEDEVDAFLQEAKQKSGFGA